MLRLLVLILLGSWVTVYGLAGGGRGYSGGGGGGFSGGGGGWSSGSSSSSSGGGDALVVIISLLFRHPVVGIPVLVGAGVAGWFVWKQQQEGRTRYRIDSSHRRRDQAADGRISAELKRSDPAFDRARLERRVRDAFRRCQQAWCGHQLDTAAAFCSDGIVERWTMQIAEQQTHGYRDRVEDLQIEAVECVHLQENKRFQVLTVGIRGRCRDYRVTPTGEHHSGSKMMQPFHEYWSFLRRAGTTSLADKPGLMEGNCPNCGAPISINRHASCQHCGAKLKNGQFDWVLAEITQPCEWRAREDRTIPGLVMYRADDPDCNVQHLEDLASVAFYRHLHCERIGSAQELAGIADPDFLTHVSEDIGKRARDRYLAECSIGSVELLGIERGSEWDQALIEVRWSAVTWTLDAERQARRGSATAPRRHAYILKRRAGASSDLDQAVVSAHCNSCGGPEQTGDGGVCGWCGSPRTTGGDAWMVAACWSWADPQVQETLRRMRQRELPQGRPDRTNPASGAATANAASAVPDAAAIARPSDVLAWAVYVAKADGSVSSHERRSLTMLATKFGISAAQVDGMLSRAGEDAQPPQPDDDATGRAWLDLLADVAWSDGTVSREERAAMSTIGQAVGMTRYDVNRLILDAKKRAMSN